MRKPLFLFSLFLIVSLILILSVQASPDTETLYVDGFNSINEEWTEVGSSPWLNDNTANEIYTKTDEYWHEEFTFANSGVGSGTINSVYLYVEMKGDSGRNDYADYFIHDGTSWTSVLQQDDDTGTYTWYSVDISTIIDTWAKIDTAKLKVQYQRAGSPSTVEIYVRRAYLYVDYTAGGQNYVVDLSQSISFTWNILAKIDFNVVPSQSITTSWDILVQSTFSILPSLDLTTSWIVDIVQTVGGIDYVADLSQSISSTWQIITSHGMFVDLSQAISTSWLVLMQWNAILDVSQAISMTWEVLIQSTFNIIPDFSVATSWVVDIIHTLAGGIDYIVDLSQTVSTTWAILTQWDAIIDFSQSISTSWEVLTQTTFNVVTSLSNTFTWIVSLIVGQEYIVDMTQAISIAWHVVIEWSAFWRMQISFEILIMFNLAIIFTIAYMIVGDFKRRITLGLISAIAWVSLAFGFIASSSTFPFYAYIFVGIGTILSASILYDSIQAMGR